MADENQIARCTGGCCKRFYLPFSPEEVQRIKESLNKGQAYYRWQSGLCFFPNQEDEKKVFNMVIHVEHSNRHANGTTGDWGHYYTCKNYDTQNNNCTIHESRPRMCREYPEYGKGRRCSYTGCKRRTTDDIDMTLLMDLDRQRKKLPQSVRGNNTIQPYIGPIQIPKPKPRTIEEIHAEIIEEVSDGV